MPAAHCSSSLRWRSSNSLGAIATHDRKRREVSVARGARGEWSNETLIL
jgi:hypothetical protein